MKILKVILLSTVCMNSWAYKVGDKVVLKTSNGCGACQEAKQLLNSKHIPYTETSPNSGKYVPQLYVNGKFKGYGVDAVESYIHE